MTHCVRTKASLWAKGIRIFGQSLQPPGRQQRDGVEDKPENIGLRHTYISIEGETVVVQMNNIKKRINSHFEAFCQTPMGEREKGSHARGHIAGALSKFSATDEEMKAYDGFQGLKEGRTYRAN